MNFFSVASDAKKEAKEEVADGTFAQELEVQNYTSCLTADSGSLCLAKDMRSRYCC